ncbi:GntR family transcriptional regulator [Acetobacteroides hydrogenigenes]|uniref:GntR family transcriptional regulator n=1 Tax=Acetobacteroides hydrogenigenes TaxID=979970 RepID=A0A4R2EVD1_9BACT|nr:GntR family transcriptional regulator [Acetobacteroides hydrogenigenes]TCN73104.1 GntR family transcriptional regulator [Acetobacteroides hydrogenigenes]
MKIKIDHSSPIPLHVQVESLLREMIELPEYKNGAFLPDEVSLSKQLGIARNTLRQAINKLVFEGLLTRKKGVGTKVSEKTFETSLDSWHSFTQEMSNKGVALKMYSLESGFVEVSERIRNFLMVDQNAQVLKVSRLRGYADAPFVFFESYFNPRIGLTGNEDFSRPLYEILERDFSIVPSLSKERISARLASPQEAALLGVNTKTPVMVRERFVYDSGMRPVEYNVGIYNAEKFIYSIDIKV